MRKPRFENCKVGCVFLFQCDVNNWKYLGCSLTLGLYLSSFLSKVKRGLFVKYKRLQEDILKYGLKSFSVQILYRSNNMKELLKIKDDYFKVFAIPNYGEPINLYNYVKTAYVREGTHHSIETKSKMRMSLLWTRLRKRYGNV